jgi:hypothetical protein
MKTGAVVRILVFGLGTGAAAAGQQEPAAPAISPVTATWRAIVVDGGAETLLLLDPGSSAPNLVGKVVPGYTVELRDPARVVFFGPGSDGTAATIFSESPPRTVGPVGLGRDCGVPPRYPPLADRFFRHQVVASADGERVTLSCSGMLVSLDVSSGAVAKQPSPPRAALFPLSDDRMLVIASQLNPLSTDIGFHDARTLARVGRLEVDAYMSAPALIPGGREILMIEHGDERAKVQQPSKLRYFDAASGAATRTISLDAPYRAARVSADGRFVYASNMIWHQEKQPPRELRILAAATGEVLEKIDLMEAASWFDDGRGLPEIVEDRRFRQPTLSRLLVLDGGGVAATVPTYNFVYQLWVDQERGRMCFLDGRSFVEYTWPDLQLHKQVAVGKILQWGGQPSDRPSIAVAPGATRALVVSGGSAVVVDLEAGAALPVVKLGSSGARARKFWADAGNLTLTILTQSGPGPKGPTVLPEQAFGPLPVAFSADGRMAMLPAPTGEITMVDMTSGRAVRHLPGGDAAMALPGVPLVVAADKGSSWVLSAATGDTVARFPVPPAHAAAPLSAAVSADGRFVLIGRGAAVHLLDVVRGSVAFEWTGFSRVAAVRFLGARPTFSVAE